MTDAKKYTSKLASKRVLITGGTSGIGYCVAEACLEQGATVILSSSQASRMQSAMSRLLEAYPTARDRLSGHACDLSSPADAERNIQTLLDQASDSTKHKLDHIVHTAGDAVLTTPLSQLSLDAIQQAGMVRFFAPLLLAKHAPPHMHPGPASSLTFTSGLVADRPIPDWTVLAGYTAGLAGMARSLALDLRPLRVNVVAPGGVLTEAWSHIPPEQLEGVKQAFSSKMCTGRMGRPEDVAEAYVYLMRDENVTGTVLGTNGGGLLM